MATYVPGAETYLPDIKPFTPDYKFLSAVLDVRTDKYNTNWKATNDLYNKVVYADLSRTDTKEQRDQYINQIAPSLEKISGMDLSLMQNADTAKGVFAPFFEDDLIVSDIMHTSNYRKEMDYANRLIDSPDDEMRGRYSADGVKGLQYHMEDFMMASPDKAMKMGLPKFIENANIMEMSQKILGEMKPPLKMKVDHYGTNPNGTVNTDWIITEQNGNLVTGAALQYIQKSLLDDPRIQRHYQNQAFVRGRDFAAEGIASGMFATKEEGQAAWASETINRINQQNEYYLKKDIKALANAQDVNVRWDNYKIENGIVPGSDDEKAMNAEMSSYEATKAALDAKFKVQEISKSPVKDFEGTLNKAYSLLMHNNISKEMQAAAQEYGARDMEYTMKVNEYAKQQKQFQFDMAKIDEQARNAEDLARLKGSIDYNLADAKGEIIKNADGTFINPVLAAVQGAQAVVGTAANAEFVVGADGLPDPNTNMYAKLYNDYSKVRTETGGKQLNVATGILTFLNPAGEIDNSGKPTQKYTVKVEGENFTGSIEQIKTKLGEKALNGNYKYQNDIDALYSQQSKILNDPKEMAKHPGKGKTQTYNNLYEQVYSDQGLNTQVEVQKQTFTSLTNTYKKTHDAAVVLVKGEDSDVKSLMEQGGMPGIYDRLPSGVTQQMSKESYIQRVKNLVAQGKVKGLDTTSMKKKEYMNYVDKQVMVNGTPRITTSIVYSDKPLQGARKSFITESVMYTDKTGKMARAEDRNQLDQNSLRLATQYSQKDIEEKAVLVYDKIKQKTNSALTGHLGNKFETGTFQGALSGRTGASDMVIAPVYRANIDPLSSSMEGQTTLAQMITQKNMLDGQGGGYTMVIGNLSDKKDSKSIVDDPLARKAYNAYIKDMTTWLGNPKRSNSADIAPRGSITYSNTLGAIGEGNKTTAGYTIDGFNEWLASKIQGSKKEDGTGEYGLFNGDEVAKLQNGITMVFDKKQDINPRSVNNQYYSKTLSAIEASPDKFVQYDYPGVDGMTPTATYRIVKTGTDQFYATYKYSTYQPNGTYSTSDWQQVPIEIGSFNAAQSVDAQVKNMKETFEIKRQMNLEDYNRNSAINGRKK